MQKNIVSARSQGHPTVNDVAVNDKILGMTVQPCRIHADGQLVTWKQISRKKDNLPPGNLAVDHKLSRELRLDLDRLCDEGNRDKRNENRIEEDVFAENRRTDVKSRGGEIDKAKNGDLTWLNGIQNLNQSYLIRDSGDVEPSGIFHSKWKPIKHSPRVEFYLKDREGEICEFERTKLKRGTLLANDEDRIGQVKELKVFVEEDETAVGCKVEETRTNDENMENNRKMCSEEIEVTACKTEALNINSRKEENKRRASYEEIKATECSKKIEINTKDTKETEKMNVAEMDKLSVHEGDEKNRQIAMDKRIIESTKYIEETERNSSESGRIIKSSSFDPHSVAWNISKKENIFDQNEDYLNFKDKVSQCKSSCNNSFELKENIVTFTCDQSNVNEIISLNNSNNQANSSPENETLACPSNNCRNSLDLIENMKEMSFSASRSISPEKNYARNIEEIELDEENLINPCNKKPKRNSKRLNFEVYSLSRNLEITASNYLLNAPSNNIPVYIEGNRQTGFSSDNFENIENNTKGEEIDFNTDSDNSCSNDKSRFLGRSIIKTEITTGEGFCEKNVDEFDYSSDNAARVGECNARDVNGLGSSVMSDYAEERSRHRGDEILRNVSGNFPKRASGATERERPVNSVEMKHRIRESMNLLRGSTDSLISSVEFVELASLRRPEANCTYERETIEIIRPNRWSKSSKDLPDIKSDAMEAKEDSEKSYWERTSKISRSRLTSVCPAYHAEYKFAKRNPRVRILPPVLSPSLINRR